MITITMTKTVRLCTAVAAVGLLFTGGITGAQAQDRFQSQAQQGQTQQRQMQQQQTNVNEEQLKAFIKAEKAARKVQDKYAGQQGQTTSQDEMAAQREQMQQEMSQAIEGNGLSIAEYNNILNAIRTDEELRQKYMNMAR